MALVAAPAAAEPQTDLDQTIAVDADVSVSVEMLVGSVVVTGWDRNEVQITGTVGRLATTDIETSPGSVDISVDPEGDDWGWDWDDERGDRRHRDVDEGQVEAHIEIRMPAGGSISIESVAAPIEISGVTGAIEVENVAGNVVIAGDPRSVDVEVITGSVEVRVGTLDSGDFENVNGDIHFEGSIAPGGSLDFETVAGAVELVLSASISATFDVETLGGSIESDFGVEARRTSDFMPSMELEFTVGGGDASVDIETINGTVTIRRQ